MITLKNFVSKEWKEWEGLLGKDGGLVLVSRALNIFICLGEISSRGKVEDPGERERIVGKRGL